MQFVLLNVKNHENVYSIADGVWKKVHFYKKLIN